MYNEIKEIKIANIFKRIRPTIVVYLSGVHGSGKTTIINTLAKKMQKAGLSVYVFSEMSYTPDIEIGTLDFQYWYKSQMETRSFLIEQLRNTKQYDFILCDRHPVDVDVYSNNLMRYKKIAFSAMYVNLFTEMVNEYKDTTIFILINRNADEIMSSIKKRLESEQHRMKWNEEDETYLKNIIRSFNEIAYNANLEIVDNITIDDAVEQIMNIIMHKKFFMNLNI